MVIGYLRGWRRARAAEREQRASEVAIPTAGGPARAVLHPVEGARGAVVMVGGARGGTRGPAGIYPVLANRLQRHGVAALRLDYRRPNRLADCVADVLAAEVVERLEAFAQALLPAPGSRAP